MDGYGHSPRVRVRPQVSDSVCELPSVLREGRGRSIMADQRHGEGFDATGWTLHARRTHRHASQCKSPGIRFLDQQPFDVLDRHMTLHEIAADLRGVAGMLCGGHAQAGLYRLEFALRSEERRVGKEGVGPWRTRGSPDY